MHHALYIYMIIKIDYHQQKYHGKKDSWRVLFDMFDGGGMNFSQAPLLIKLDILHNYFSPSIIFLNIIKTFLTEGKDLPTVRQKIRLTV